MEINLPLIIVHQPDGENGPLRCILSGPEGIDHRHFSVIIADIVRHVSRAMNVEVAEVLALVKDEIDDPTSDTRRLGPN